ncbi:MAG TPA: hypothetical protein VK013_05280 [Myxococcaceae bacterium]|nr:hypothetical protein [Myxococcaceae bacterium]
MRGDPQQPDLPFGLALHWLIAPYRLHCLLFPAHVCGGWSLKGPGAIFEGGRPTFWVARSEDNIERSFLV